MFNSAANGSFAIFSDDNDDDQNDDECFGFFDNAGTSDHEHLLLLPFAIIYEKERELDRRIVSIKMTHF